MANKQQKFLGLSKNIWIWAGVGYLGYMIFRPRLTQTTTTSGGTVTPPPTRTTTSGDGLSTAPTVDGIYIGAIDENKVDRVINSIFINKDIYKILIKKYLPKIKKMVDNDTYTDKAGYGYIGIFLNEFTALYRQYSKSGIYALSKEEKKYVITYILDFLLDEFTNYEY